MQHGGVRSTHGKQAKRICWQGWWLCFRDVDCQPCTRKKNWECLMHTAKWFVGTANQVFFSISSQISQTKQLRVNQQQHLHSAATRSASNTCSASFRDEITHYQRVTWHVQNEMLAWNLHSTYIKHHQTISNQPTLPILRLESAGKVGAPVLGERFARMLPRLVLLPKCCNPKQHFSIEAYRSYMKLCPYLPIAHPMASYSISCRSSASLRAKQAWGRRQRAVIFVPVASSEADQTWQPWEYFTKFDKIHFKPVATFSAFLEGHRHLRKLLPNSTCQTKQNKKQMTAWEVWIVSNHYNPYPLEILLLTRATNFYHERTFIGHWPLLPKNVTVDFKLHFSGSSS